MIIFLDFDGVLHTNNGKKFSLMKNLEKVVKKCPNIKIVFSTSWREYSSLENLTKYFSEEIKEKCIGMTPFFSEQVQHVRYYEILKYLEENKVSEPWIAVDDLKVLFPPDCENLFLVKGNEGLSDNNANLLIKKINTISNRNKIKIR
jgi:hypothetical protein